MGKGVLWCKSYKAVGQKVKKSANLGTTNNLSGTSFTEYFGGFQYNNDVLQFFPHAQGYVKHTVNPSNGASEFDYVYQYKDHLGNIRINYTFDPASSSLRVLEENHYYPFGLKHQENLQTRSIRFEPLVADSNIWVKGVRYAEPAPPMAALVENSGYQYKYNGKEYQDELGLNVYDYGARNYDPALGRWMNIDPLAEEFSDYSPYSYVYNDPVRHIDPDGMAPDDIVIKGLNNSSVTLKTDLIDISVDASGLGVDFGGNYSLQGEDIVSAGLDIVGIVDPTGVADGLNAGLQAKNGDWLGAGISVLGIIPYVGDVAKLGKIGKDVKIIENAIDAVKAGDKGKDLAKASGKLDKSPTGPGTVPKSDRDPKRVPTAKEKKEQLSQQDNKCANCDKKTTEKDSRSHHYPKRHSDGGKETVQVCKDCHKDLHKKN